MNTHVLFALHHSLLVGDIRTLQWDTDPSVLQLQADSELGYMFLFSPIHRLTKKRTLEKTF